MGELAEQRINGSDCELCGMPFEEEHGYPCVCKECWQELSKSERKSHQKAIHNTI